MVRKGFKKEVNIGERFDLKRVSKVELDDGEEDIAVVVSGPARMTDDMKRVVCEVGRAKKEGEQIVLMDETFS